MSVIFYTPLRPYAKNSLSSVLLHPEFESGTTKELAV